ncbi:MAG: o-succinylbenzoate--CoA ligase [Halorubrum sp.]|uniref:o-succinylbenzoate--CoA ligase n=1 Tax=Haloferacaceae TaxID=1644056 RepID=UPI0010FB475D|nr:o-succinylbenzoate--CoA ligase [Halalkalirubrum salinum]
MRDWLTHRARSTPDASAIVAADGDKAWTYAGLDRAVEEAAGRLRALGVRSGDHVALLLEPSVTMVGLFHASMRIGAVVVPLGTRLTPRELHERLERSDAMILICSEETESVAIEAAGDIPVTTTGDPQWESVACLPEIDPEAGDDYEWSRKDTQLLLSTSGSTGAPKLVPITMGNLLASAVASGFKLGIDPDDRWLVTLPLSHMGGIAPLFRSVLYGTTVVIRPSFDPGGAADDIDRYGITVVSLVPTMLTEMLDSRGTLSESLRAVLLGGAPASAKLIDRCRNYSIPVYPTYGMTETSSQIATATPEQAFERPDTVGQPLMWTDVTIVSDDGTVAEPGTPGEIHVSGPTVTPGYYGEAVPGAFSDYGLRTGDIGYVDDTGYLFVSNRIDDRIITGGENVDPGEVAEVLCAEPKIEDAAVVGIDDETWGQRVAALVVRNDDSLTAEAVDSYCRERLAGYKIPRFLVFATEIPRTVSGTIDREAVRDRLAAFADRAREAHGIPDAETEDVLVPEDLIAGDEHPESRDQETNPQSQPDDKKAS